MFLQTDLRYNDNGEIFEIIKDEPYENLDFRYEKKKLSSKEKYVQQYRSRVSGGKYPTAYEMDAVIVEKEQRSRMHKQRDRRFRPILFWLLRKGKRILDNYKERIKLEKPLLPGQKNLKQLLHEHAADDYPEMEALLQPARLRFRTPTLMKFQIMFANPIQLTPANVWNQFFVQTRKPKSKEQLKEERERQEWEERWGAITARLPEEAYDAERGEWRRNLEDVQDEIVERRAEQDRIEMDVAGDLALAQRLQEEEDRANEEAGNMGNNDEEEIDVGDVILEDINNE